MRFSDLKENKPFIELTYEQIKTGKDREKEVQNPSLGICVYVICFLPNSLMVASSSPSFMSF